MGRFISPRSPYTPAADLSVPGLRGFVPKIGRWSLQVIRRALLLLPIFAFSTIWFSSVWAQTPASVELETFRTLYKWTIFVTIAAAFIIQAFLIIRLLITQRRCRQAEIESRRLAVLAKSEQKRLEEVVSDLPGIVWEGRTDPSTGQWSATFINEYAEKMTGYTVEEWLSIPGLGQKIVHEDDREKVARETEAVFAGAEPARIQFRWIAKDGHIIWAEAHVAPLLDETGATIGIRGVTLDITEQHAAEEARRQSDERFRNMADIAPVMIWISDEHRKGTYFNKQWLDFTGRTFEQELGDGWTEGIHPEDYNRTLEICSKSVNDRKSFEMEFRIRRSDGEYRWIYDTGTPLFSPDQKFLGYIGSAIDITERKESEVKLHQAHEELQQLKNQLEAENVYLQQELQLDPTFGEIVGQSDAIKYVLFKLTQVAPTDTTVLITGETGTGKELVARAIHGASSRKDRPLIKVNCGALSPSLIESELFGHERGAFTGAAGRKLGRFELANGGTIFLDEIGELPLELQVKLLRVIQENEFERLGGTKTIKVDVRIIAATNRNLKLEVENGNFREDLWYRLNVYPITVPPLRQRKEDIPLLVEHFVNGYAKKFGKTITSVSPRALQRFQSHSWPGSVRELANAIERAVIHAKGSVLHSVDRFEEVSEEPPFSAKTLEEVEREYILRTLENTGWRIEGPNGAANILGLNPSTLRTRMVKLGIQRRSTVA